MMYLPKEELRSAIYEYQLGDITEGDDSIVEMAINAAIEEVKSYLSGKYNTDTIFAQQGENRNPLILAHAKTLAVWHIIQLANVDIIYDKAKERYDRCIDWLNRCANGKLNPDLPPATGDDGNIQSSVRFGSMAKQQYDY
ncbi:MAG: phage protein Gp36 family protein [Bacteroidales bacterium]